MKKQIPLSPAVWIKQINARRADAVIELLDYIQSDLCCYCTTNPPALAAKQTVLWNPVLDWIADRYGERPAITSFLSLLPPNPSLRQSIATDIAHLSEDEFGALYIYTTTAGSIFLGLMMLYNDLSVTQAIDAHFCEEEYFDAIARKDTDNRDPMLVKRRSAMTQTLQETWDLLQH